MASSEDENPMETHCDGDIMIEDDDVTVVSGAKATETDYIDQEMTEMVLRFEIPYRNGHAADDDFKLHAQLLQLMTTTYDATELRIVNNKNHQIKDFNEEKWFDKAYHTSHFGVHADNSGRKTVVAHRIRSKHKLVI
jgi:DNA polymerase III epsilon subunit-like protein